MSARSETADWAKLDRLVEGWKRALNKPAYIASIWSDLNREDGARFLDSINKVQDDASINA